ncbi:putative TIR domain, P-loop containing nucleoside triphosphate hydrolase [Helianthus annuus]|nr:putative TIR domain, P-loop containing nucleoside triphosphate hydrolase [Helianthus annuus]
MASTSSSTSSTYHTPTSSSTSSTYHTPTYHSPTITYDVFLSFRGIDTRHTFTDYLYKALLRANLRTFRDDNAIPGGEVLKPEIETAIKESRASIVVLSENYANSRWCLDELCLIFEQRRNCGHFVLPIFYHVEPSDVRHQTGSFAIEELNWTADVVRRWKEALTMVSNLKGETLTRYETDFIEKVVEKVISKLDLRLVSTPAHLTGMETRVEDVNSWLKNEQYNAIAICGMGGIGKTTLAQCIYNSNKHNFESKSFVEKIGENYKLGLRRLQKQLLRDVLGNDKIKISNALEGTFKIEEVLQTKKVLIVLDDIDDEEELTTLLGTKAFYTQSKIIITTRLLDIDAWFVSKSFRCMVHKLESLNVQESLELFSWHAFGFKYPMEGFKELAQQLVKYCGGNPLALKVLGSSLYVCNEDPRKRNTMIEIWRDRVNSLNSSKGDLDCKIQDVLRKSFDALQFENHKELFLDIACFFVGESKDMLTIWRDDLHVKYGIMTLISRCLLTISPDANELAMHQLLQDMGRKIVCEESKDPSKRSRVWHDDAYRVLRKGEGSNTIEGMALDMKNLGQGSRSEPLALKTSSLSKIENLKLLQLKHVTLTGSYENFPELRWLCWQGCPLETMHPGLLKSSLVAINMSYGHMETFEAPTVLNSLKILNLEGCDELVSIRKLRRLPKLETLILSSCSSLTHLSKYIGDMESLALLDLKGCTKLFKASSNKKYVKPMLKRLWIDRGDSEQPLFSLPCSLRFLHLNDCKIKCNNDVRVSFHDKSFFNMYLGYNIFEFLPTNIDLKMLQTLNLYSCSLLKSLTCIPSTLEELYIDKCCSLERVTFESGHFKLQQFSYKDCSQLSEIQSLFKLVPVAKIDVADMVQPMQWIKEYENREADLVGDDIIEGRDRQIQMLYEYGITSTYLQGIKDQNMMTYKHKSPFPSLSFCVPSHHENKRIQGLNVSCLYRSSRSMDKDMWLLLAKIRNITQGVTWIYNPVVYCKPRVDEDVVWLSYWPIGNILDVGDEVIVDIIVDKGVVASECRAILTYVDVDVDGEVESYQNNTTQGEEVIGGDLSQFEVTTKGYYLCRRNLFGLETSSWLKQLFDNNVDYPESEGWRKTR